MLSSLIVRFLVAATSQAQADTAAPVTQKVIVKSVSRSAYHKGLMLGICVDQALVAQGITLKLPVAGQSYTIDDSTKTAVAAAVTQCRATLLGSSASAVPVASATPASTTL